MSNIELIENEQFRSLALIVLLGALSLSPACAHPVKSAHHLVSDGIPKLSDTLSVAKSPFEPMTLSPNRPGGRNNENLQLATTMVAEPVTSDQRQTTRSVANQEQGESVPSSTALDESTSPQAGASSPVGPIETTTLGTPAETTTLAGSDETSRTSGEVVEASRDSSIPTTTPEPATSTSTTETPAKEEGQETSSVSKSDADAPSTTAAPAEPKTPTGASTEPPEEATTSTESSVTSEVSADSFPKLDGSNGVGNFKGASSLGQNTTNLQEDDRPDSTTVSPSPKEAESSSPDVEKEQPVETTTVTPSTTTVSTTIITSTTHAPEPEPTTPVATTTSTTTTTTTTTTTPSPTTTVSTTTTEEPKPETVAPIVTTTQAISTSSSTVNPVVASVDSDLEKNLDEKQKEKYSNSCNHLPTYGTDEIQKVFREETTYRNGTIKGKFTYINFDQRYRLVHYTRLPYGPVKIDLVEELGKPDQGALQNNQSQGSSSLSEIPNAVLQLRNLLPTSLFGFPFLGPNSGQLGPISGARDYNNNNDRSNMYFYSTDSLSTPNLLTPQVPVSLLPGQSLKKVSPIEAGGRRIAADSLSQSYIEQALASGSAGRTPLGAEYSNPIGQSEDKIRTINPTLVDQEELKQYHRQLYHSNLNNPRSLVYDYLSSQPNLAPAHFQPPPVYQSPVGFSYDQPRSMPITNQAQQIHHQAHQPHSHEHYIAPFMFAQPPNASGELNESSRLRLKVKTSKALNNPEQTGVKSAQLRLQSNGLYMAPANSPVQQHRGQQIRQRLGKQHNDLKYTNSHHLPIVYHVLRSPAGRTFTVPQSNQGYAIAFDHND